MNEWMTEWMHCLHPYPSSISFILRCVCQERISIRGSVRPSVRPLVRPSVRPSVGQLRLCKKPRFSAVFGHDEILHWNKWATHMFWESFHPSVCPSVSPYICHMINTRWDTARTHRCPVGLVNSQIHALLIRQQKSDRVTKNKEKYKKQNKWLTRGRERNDV